MEQESLIPQYQQIAKHLIRVSHSLNTIFLDQIAIVGNLTAQNMFKIEQEQHKVVLANGLFYLKFHTPYSMRAAQGRALAEFHIAENGYKSEQLEEFFLQDVLFLTGDQKPQHSLFLRDKAQHLRKIIIEDVYRWTHGANRVRIFFQQLSFVQADIIDHLMMKVSVYKKPIMSRYVSHGEDIPEHILQLFEKIFSLEYLLGDEFLPLQSLMHSLDEFCFSAGDFLNPAVYRIMGLSFEERFNLLELNEHIDDIELLFQHAIEHDNLLGFVRLMNRDLWKRNDLLSKKNFLELNDQLWQKKVAKLPLFDCHRAVNWLFKQSNEVLDWLSLNIQHSSVRVAVTAMSFIDTHHIHPQVILATLQYFQYASARLFVHTAHQFAIQHQWFQHANNKTVVLKGTRQAIDDHRVAISPSILYLDEWIGLMREVVGMDDQSIKKVYVGLSRVMQAYIQHLYKVTMHLPNEVLQYIRPSAQQNRDFYNVLQRYQIQLAEFRQLFYLQDVHVRESIFDSYVRDYLAEYFGLHQEIPKSLTWKGLFLQAVTWHDHIQKQDIIAKLRKDFALANWTSITQDEYLNFYAWKFKELKTLDQIIEESKIFRNCLAASYAQRIIEGEYVVFHVSHTDMSIDMLLGCLLRNGHLVFDQLEYPNNQKAEAEYRNMAIHFTTWFNQRPSLSQPVIDLDKDA